MCCTLRTYTVSRTNQATHTANGIITTSFGKQGTHWHFYLPQTTARTSALESEKMNWGFLCSVVCLVWGRKRQRQEGILPYHNMSIVKTSISMTGRILQFSHAVIPIKLTSMYLNNTSLDVWFDPTFSSNTRDQLLGSPRAVWLTPLKDEDWRAGGFWIRKVSFYIRTWR